MKKKMTEPRIENPRGFDLGSLIKGFAELGGVKGHLFTASREILLAVQGSLGLVDHYVGTMSDSDRQQIVRLFLGYAKKTIRGVANQLPRGNEKEFRDLHAKVLHSILDVIDAEIRKNRTRTQNPKGKMKDEVLHAIRSVLVKEME